jgi:hypothetical protein
MFGCRSANRECNYIGSVYAPNDAIASPAFNSYVLGSWVENGVNLANHGENTVFGNTKCKNEWGDLVEMNDNVHVHSKKYPDHDYVGNSTVYCGSCNKVAGYQPLCPALFNGTLNAPGECNCKTRTKWLSPNQECTPEELSRSCVQCRKCTRCLDGYTRDKLYSAIALPAGPKCSKCEEYWVHIMIFLAGLVVTLVMITYLVEQNMQTVGLQYSAAIYRILMSHMQLLSIVQRFNLNWPAGASAAFEAAQTISDFGAGPLLSLDCLLGDYDIFMPSQYKKALIWAVLPIVILLTYEIISAIIFREGNEERRVVIFLVIMFLLYPHLVFTTLQMLSCIRLDDDKWFMNGDLDVQCYHDQRHTTYTFVISIPMLIVYVIGIPLAVAYIIFKHRKQLDSLKTIKKLHVAIVGYRPNRSAYGAVSMFQKSLFVAVAVFGSKFGGLIQTYGGLAVVMVCMGMHFIFKPYEIVPAGYDYDKMEYSSVYKADKLQNLEAGSWMTIVVTMYAGWITVIPDAGIATGDTLWETVIFGVTTLIVVFNIMFFVWAAWMYVLELSREGKLGESFNKCIHGCHRIQGKTKSKKAKRKLKKMSSIVVPGGGGGSRSTKMVAAQEETNSITKLEGKLLRLARKLFSPGTPEYSSIARLIIQVSREEIDIGLGKEQLLRSFGTDNTEAVVLIDEFIDKLMERSGAKVEKKEDPKPTLTEIQSFNEIQDLFGNVLNDVVVVEDAHDMDEKQQKHAKKIRKEFKKQLRESRDRKSTFEFDGSGAQTKSINKMLTEVLKSKDHVRIKQICTDVQSVELAAKTFKNQLSILNDIVAEGQEKAMKDLQKAINDPNSSHEELQSCLDKVALLDCPGSDALVKEGLEVFIRAEHFSKLRKLVDDIGFKAFADIAQIGESNESVAVIVRAMLLLIGTPPKEVASFDNCIELVTKTGKESIKSRVRSLDILSLKSKKKTLKLVGKMLLKIKVDDLTNTEAGKAFYGFVAGVMAELDHSYLVTDAVVDPTATLSWGNGKDTDDEKGIEKSKVEEVSAGEQLLDNVEVDKVVKKKKTKT